MTSRQLQPAIASTPSRKLWLVILSAVTLLGAASASSPDPAFADAAEPYCRFTDDPEGKAPLNHEDDCDPSNCDQGVVGVIVDQLCSLVDGQSALDGAVSCRTCKCCQIGDQQVETGIFTGVTLGPPTGSAPEWCRLGGRGERMGEAALCFLRDLGNHINGPAGATGFHSESSPPIDIGLVKVKQHVGYLDFDPTARRMHGYHSVSVRVPVFGTIDDLTQQFTAELESTASPVAGSCGDYPVDRSFVLKMDNDDLENALAVRIPGLIHVDTPYGVSVDVSPEFKYGTFLKTVKSPYGATGANDHDRQQDASFSATLWDRYGSIAGAETVVAPISSGAAGRGWVSQLGLGGRESDPAADIWFGDDGSGTGFPRPDAIAKAVARNPLDKVPTVEVGAAVEININVLQKLLSYIPEDIRNLFYDPQFEVFVKPKVGTTLASQFNVYASEADFRELAGPKSRVVDDPLLGPTRTTVRVDAGTEAQAAFSVESGVNIGFTIDFFFFSKRFEFHPSVTMGPYTADDTDDLDGPIAEAVSEQTPDGGEPAFSKFRSLSGGSVDGLGFIEDCLAYPVPATQSLPQPLYTKGDPKELGKWLRYPCNVCLHLQQINSVCVPEAGVAPGAKVTTCGTAINGAPCPPGCKTQAVDPKNVNLDELLFTADTSSFPPEKQWECDAYSKMGCFDVCVQDPATGSFTVVQSAVDTPEGGARCNGTDGGGGPGGDGVIPTPCDVDAECDDANECTQDYCDVPIIKGRTASTGTCKHTSQPGSCDDGLRCNGVDTCLNGHCGGHLGNPCAGGCCNEAAAPGNDICQASCGPTFLSTCDGPDGAACDDGDACTSSDTCIVGLCRGRSLCDDQNDCTDDFCGPDGALTCLHVANGFCPTGCGDGILQTGEACDGANDAACPGLCVPAGAEGECTCSEGCGNRIVEPLLGETCDPPGSPAGASGAACRADCTVCGDGVLQAPAGETCDDGNAAECDATHPQKELDGCNNECGGLICDDPSRIVLRQGLDVVRFHGRLTPIMGRAVDLLGDARLTLTAAGATVFDTALAAGAVRERGNGREFYYRNRAAKRDGGIYRLRATRASNGTYKTTIVAYGDLGQATADMVTHVASGSQEWTVHGDWQRTGSGWVFGRGR